MNFQVGTVRWELLGRARAHDAVYSSDYLLIVVPVKCRWRLTATPQALEMSTHSIVVVPSKAARMPIWLRQSRDQQFFLRNLPAMPHHSILGIQFADGPQTLDI